MTDRCSRPAEIVPVTLGAQAILGWARTTRPW